MTGSYPPPPGLANMPVGGSSKDREGPPPSKKQKVGPRASLACLICRKRKVRCSADFPTCSFCNQRGLVCEYDGHPDTAPAAPRPAGHGSPSETPQAPLPFAADLPPRELIKEAAAAFFLHYSEESLFTFLHRPTLFKSIENDSASQETLLCTLAVAGRFSHQLKAQRGGAAAVSSHYGDQALALIRSTPGEISLARLHSHLLLGLNDCTENETSRGWLHIGSALRMAQLLRLGFLDEEDPARGVEKQEVRNWKGEPIVSASTPHGSEPGETPPHSTVPVPTLLPTAQILDLEIKRRTWWSCYLLERLFCDGRSLSALLRAQDVTTRFPCADSDFVIGRRGASARFAGPAPPWGPMATGGVVCDDGEAHWASLESPSASTGHELGSSAAGPSRPRYANAYARGTSSHSDPHEPDADLYGQMMRVADLWAQVRAYIANGGRNRDRRAPWTRGSSFWQLDRKLNQWDESLPAHLQYSESTLTAHSMIGQGKLYGLMHILYFTALLYLHRDYIPFIPPLDYDPAIGPVDGDPMYFPADADRTPPANWWADSAATCFRAANAITDMFINLKSRGSELTNPFAGFAVLTAGTMHIHLCYWPSSAPDSDPPHEYLSSDTRILNDMRQYWSAADLWCQALNTNYALNSLINDRNTTTTSISQPLHAVRSGVMAIIRAVHPDDGPESPGEAAKPIDVTELLRKKHDLFSKLTPPRSQAEHLGNGFAQGNGGGAAGSGTDTAGPGPFQPLDLFSTFPQLFASSSNNLPLDPALQNEASMSGSATPNRGQAFQSSNTEGLLQTSDVGGANGTGNENALPLDWSNLSSFFAGGWNNPILAGAVGGGPAGAGPAYTQGGQAGGMEWLSTGW